MAVDLGTGEPLTLGYINEYNPQAVARWLKPLVQRHGINVIVTDDLSSYILCCYDSTSIGKATAHFNMNRWFPGPIMPPNG